MKKNTWKKIIENKRVVELVKYGLFGLATTVINIAVYHLLLFVTDYWISNIIAIIASKTFAYITNKHFVFHSKCGSRKELLMEIGRFILARGATGLFDYFALIAAVELFHFDRVWSKYVIQLIVILLNYILGKKAVFTGTKNNISDEYHE